MSKLEYIVALAAAVFMFNSCVNRKNEPSAPTVYSFTNPYMDQKVKKSYGAYMAGRVAHLRKDFNAAADYYIQALKVDPDNPELISRVYLILTSKGRVAEAAQYAELSLKNGDKNNFIHIIIAADKIKKGQYEEANKIISGIDCTIYKEFITPLISAWSYAGMNEKGKALKAMEPIGKEPSFRALYNFHMGMLNDYFGDNSAAQKYYEVIVNEESLEMSFRALQVITNFYIRSGQKDKALALVNKYSDERVLADMMEQLKNKIKDADPEETPKIISSANIGVSEALFNIAATLRQGSAGIDLAHMFISLSIYENPNYDLAMLLLADILETREMYLEANKVYDRIGEDSEAYNTAQLKKANNLVLMEDYKGAELLMKALTLDKGNYQLYLDLGDVLRVSGKQKEAISYYKDAIKSLPRVENQHWVLFYAMGISYEQNDEWDKAEKAFLRALDLSQNHYMVLNYLGYSWLKEGKNIDQAFGMIVEAYNQAPHDGNINDSLGWAFYRMGMYDQAVTYLEKAAEIEPANALISDHLGDAYWMNGRKNEAKFQWQHALTMKDRSNELDAEAVKEKLDKGGTDNKPVSYDKEAVQAKIESIITED